MYNYRSQNDDSVKTLGSRNGPTSPFQTTTPAQMQARAESTIAPYYTLLNGVDEDTNMLCRNILWGTIGLVVAIVLMLRLMESLWNKIRQRAVHTTEEENQISWKKPRTGWTSKVKKHLIYASLWNKRHHREYRFGTVSFGTIPSRLHMSFILFYLVSNVVYMTVLNYDNPNRYAVYAELRGRSGTLCVANFVPLIILAGRNNPLIHLLRISFDTYNLFHRWVGRIAVLEIIIHTVAWMVPVVADGGWALVRSKLGANLFIGAGFTGTIAMVLILVLSLSPMRHAFYETFLNLHIFLAILVFTCTWMHCASSGVPGGLPQLPWIMTVVYLWVADRTARIARTLYTSWPGREKRGKALDTNAVCEAMPGEVTRVTVHLPRHVNIKPGSHAYLRFRGVHVWENHPFSIAWVNHDDQDSGNESAEPPSWTGKLPCRQANRTRATSASFIIAARSGMTRKLYNKASSCADGLRLTAFMEGPYAGYHNLDSYGHIVLFAGAGGITHQISYPQPLLEGSNAGTVAMRRLTLVWIVRDHRSLEWVRPHLEELGGIPNCAAMLRVKIYVTGRDQAPMHGALPSEDAPMIRVSFGRPDLLALLAEELEEQIGAMCVSVCGSGGLADDVRDTVRAAQGASVVDFYEESFTW
ncbi:hypothetical protein QQS21_000771 [Conoideocrella luteorostrata]|uniref:ferric-chelate reductase (NADPH) n=1 Tax=Conoideocrella luteorostrata TaxID=1105319 RepID=A0AAJ0CYF8_9HYPO|nr:hypothetical protein QQS21_000771 [Conoideocrella luteorostrata]